MLHGLLTPHGLAPGSRASGRWLPNLKDVFCLASIAFGSARPLGTQHCTRKVVGVAGTTPPLNKRDLRLNRLYDRMF